MSWRGIGTIVAALALMPGAASADGVEIAPFAGFRIGGDLDTEGAVDAEFEEEFSYGLAVDVPVRRGTQIEVLWSHQSTELVAGEGIFGSPRVVEFDVDYFHVGGLWEWGPSHPTRPYKRKRENTGPADDEINQWRPVIRPFVTVTGGVAEWNPRDVALDSETLLSLGFGGGAKFIFARHVGVRLEGRFFGSFYNSGGDSFCSPDECLGQIPGSVLLQFEAAAGLVFKF